VREREREREREERRGGGGGGDKKSVLNSDAERDNQRET
jgi:hypothetical protein